ncbi:MAG TPA: glycoside hydrolase family 3 C-terminal domain-containing protein [Terriglobia bacterium]|nr:glycoside hydrolase family 3 C-terminal domain-containing protein [Terriglobia bacterium]
MTFSGNRNLVTLFTCFALIACTATAQDVAKLPYMNPSLSPQQRAADLVGRMTLQEKASQLTNESRAIPRLGVPSYNWWSEALHGVASDGTTEYPEPIGLAATFDVPGIHEMATDIGIEGRVVHAKSVHNGNSIIFHGLDFWSPNVNIFRDPRWGRGQETYGEDPFLSARMAVAFVTGMQGDDPKYYRVISTPKHFAVHSGPEPTRHFADVDVSKHDILDTYEPAFRAAVVEGHAGSVMCAYNAINGQPACASEFLLQDQLRGKWGFQGYVVSDCDAVRDILSGHHYRSTQPQASAISLERGMDNECYGTQFPNDSDYQPYIQAVQEGYLPESAIDKALIRLYTARFRLGLFDPPEMVPYSKIDAKELNSAEHRALARKLANESMVLLKNDGTLPLKSSITKIAVVGPLADQTAVLLGNYNGTPTHTVSALEGLKAEFPKAGITYVPGIQFLSNQTGNPMPASMLTTPDGKPGLKAEYSSGLRFGPSGQPPTPLTSRVEPNVDLNESNLPEQAKGKPAIGVQWTGFLNPAKSGEYLVGIKANGFARLTLEEKQVAAGFGNGSHLGSVHLEKGHPLKLELTYGHFRGGPPEAQIVWAPVNNQPDPAALAAAKNADVVIAVVGITSRLEGEEMPVNEPGFLGGDRTSIDLPEPEEALIEAVAATRKPLVVVLMNGSALAVNWPSEHANAILESWYSGEEGGAAIAETLSGKNNPAGRLPVTFYKDISQLPHFESYAMEGRTYRYFRGKPLFPFGYGLSYATFSYSDLTLPQAAVNPGDPVAADVTVTNTGKVAGDEVVQLYLKFPLVKGAPIIALRGFQRIHLEPGASQKVHFELKNRDLGMVTDDGNPIIAGGEYSVTIGGGQPDTGAPGVTGHFRMEGQIALPE